MKIVYGNILDFDGWIVHQCNCTTTQVAGLAYQVFNKYPEAHHKDKERSPGTIDVSFPVINLYGQVLPGPPSLPRDTAQLRLAYFEHALNAIKHQFDPETRISFPYKIGCGLGGGDWGEYNDRLLKFDIYTEFDVYMYVYGME